jgi:amino acid adenylation domain-containing protein
LPKARAIASEQLPLGTRERAQDSCILTETEEERRKILIEWNQTACDYPREKCLHELVAAQAQLVPERVAVIWKDQQLSYREFNSRANQLAHYLSERGVGPSAKVAICLNPSLDFAVAVLAVLKSGAACVPLDPKYPQERLAYMLHDVGARVLITERGILSDDASAGCQLLFLAEKSDALDTWPTNNPTPSVTTSDIAYVIYTSGSTGKPRGVLLPHAGLVNYTFNMARVYSMSPDDRVLQFCSVSFDIAVEELFIAWLSGAALVMKSDEMPLAVPEFLYWIERQGITVLDLPTAYWHEWMHQISELGNPAPERLRLVIVGGEKVSAKAYAAWAGAVGRRVRWVNTYGPTEGSIAATAYEPKSDTDTIPENVPIGRPVANVRVYLLDPQLNPVAVGVAGELHIGGVGVARGYLNRPELTAEKFISDPFSTDPDARLYKTGDLARYLPSGEIEFVGRTDDQVKIRGFRVELGEIEVALAKHPALREVAVVAREDEAGDKHLVAYVVPAPEAEITTSELRRYLQRQVPEHMVPSAFMVLPAMPLTPNGKIDRRGLPAPEAEVSGETTAATDVLESQLVKIWEDVIGKKPIGIRDDFFELGGHSLLAAKLMYRTGQMLGKNLPLAMLVESPTIEQLAAALRQDGWSHHWSSLVPIQPGGSEPPFFCIHGVGGNAIGFHELGRRMGPDYPFYGLQSQGLDGKHPCHTGIAEMAAHYIGEIRSVHPEGPYFVGGFSFGGLVAYEMAQQLRAGGQEVGLLVLFDTYPGNLKAVGTSLIELLLHPTWQHWVHDLPRIARKRIRRSLRNWRVPQVLRDVRDSNATAADRYELRPYAGKAALIRAAEKSLRSSQDPLAAWNGLISNLDIHEIPGDHYDMLVEPQVNTLAECLKSCIEKAGSESEHRARALQAG